MRRRQLINSVDQTYKTQRTAVESAGASLLQSFAHFPADLGTWKNTGGGNPPGLWDWGSHSSPVVGGGPTLPPYFVNIKPNVRSKPSGFCLSLHITRLRIFGEIRE